MDFSLLWGLAVSSGITVGASKETAIGDIEGGDSLRQPKLAGFSTLPFLSLSRILKFSNFFVHFSSVAREMSSKKEAIGPSPFQGFFLWNQVPIFLLKESRKI